MTLIVSDTGPINYLILIGNIELLPRLANRIVLPTGVHHELLNASAPGIVRAWAANLPGWIEVKSARESIKAKGLSAADCEAITLAKELNATLLLTDDRQARRCASGLGLATMGTLGLLEAAAQRGLISLPEALERLRATSCFLSEELVENAIQRDRDRKK